jgi:MerR family transcriptional regulator, light-induced transcriptional regulator
VAAVARRLGVAPATLRTWDRRYGLGPSEHTAGAHRRYSSTDVDRLMVMRRLTLAGVAPADAARAALTAEAAGDVVAQRTPGAVADAAVAHDKDALQGLLRITPDQDPVSWWLDLVAPARDLLARRTVLDRPGQDADLALRSAAADAIRDRVVPVHPTAGVVLLLAPGPSRPLVLHVVAAALGGVDARMVSGPMSARHLVELVAMTRARVVVTVTEQAGADLSLVHELGDQCVDLAQIVLVPNEDFGRIPLGPAIQRARTLPGLIHELRAVLAVPEGVRDDGSADVTGR